MSTCRDSTSQRFEHQPRDSCHGQDLPSVDRVELLREGRQQLDGSCRPDPSNSNRFLPRMNVDGVPDRSAPPSTDSPGREANGMRDHVVQSGDCLWKIAKRALKESGDSPSPRQIQDAVQAIVEANKSEHPSLSRNPNLIIDGWHLKIPTGGVDQQRDQPNRDLYRFDGGGRRNDGSPYDGVRHRRGYGRDYGNTDNYAPPGFSNDDLKRDNFRGYGDPRGYSEDELRRGRGNEWSPNRGYGDPRGYSEDDLRRGRGNERSPNRDYGNPPGLSEDDLRRRRDNEYPPNSDQGPTAGPNIRLRDAALRAASRIGTVGRCAAGVQVALAALGHGEFMGSGNAWPMGRVLEQSGKFQRVPISQAAEGDVIVRSWNNSVIAQNGGRNYGDIVVVTGRKGNQLMGANDHHGVIHPDGGRYQNSYALRLVV